MALFVFGWVAFGRFAYVEFGFVCCWFFGLSGLVGCFLLASVVEEFA